MLSLPQIINFIAPFNKLYPILAGKARKMARILDLITSELIKYYTDLFCIYFLIVSS